MKKPIEFIYLTHKCFKGDRHIFTLDNSIHPLDINLMDDWLKKYQPRTAHNYKGEWRFEEISKPTTFPKFSNETNFYIKWDKGKIKNPEILGIRWDGEWSYRLKNIGHEYDYQSESKLVEF